MAIRVNIAGLYRNFGFSNFRNTYMSFIKWTGSKRSIAPKIIEFFPKNINTYYEPFVGGGSVFFQLLRSNIKVEQFEVSDTNEDLIGIYKLLQTDPNLLIDSYSDKWSKLQKDTDYYYSERDHYNKTKSPLTFYFLTRTCYNGTIRYNQKGEFNTSYHFGRSGMKPFSVTKIIKHHHDLMVDRNINFVTQSYENTRPRNSDVVYLDPPYTNNSSLYHGNIDHKVFTNWLSGLNCSWFLNLNGINSTDNEEELSVLFDGKVLLNSGKSSYSRLKGDSIMVKEYFYYKYGVLHGRV